MILVSWIGQNDLSAVEGGHQGPVLATLLHKKFEKAYLLYNYEKKLVAPYLEWLSAQVETPIEPILCKLSSPVHYPDIYAKCDEVLADLVVNQQLKVAILLSPGTPAMQVVWIILGKTLYPVTFFQSSREEGVQQVEIPFDISAEFVPELVQRAGKSAQVLFESPTTISTAFDDIITSYPPMESLKAQATVMATRDVPVLIYGETGTGKELFARAIHNASHRKDKPFEILNCGAIPPELIESTLFGHTKGAFTGAIKDKTGVFQRANGGTVFLDEFGELSQAAQVALLRVLQDGEVLPVGGEKPIKVDVRLITATNRNLIEEIAEGSFREDLYYRVAVGVLNLPPLRERKGDISLLIDSLLEKINEEASNQPGYKHKNISIKGRNIMFKQPWKGNVRELYATLVRASLWSSGETITEEAISISLFETPQKGETILNREIGNNFNIQEVMDEVERHYTARAWEQSGKNQKIAADMLGYNNYQSFKKRLEKYGIS